MDNKLETVDERRKKLIETGKTQIKVARYQFGAASWGSFLDCSAFVSLTFLHALGKKIPRTTFAMLAGGGKFIKREQLKPGDIMVSDGSSGGHTAIYVGNGQILHASSPTRGILISSLDESLNYQAKKGRTVYYMNYID